MRKSIISYLLFIFFNLFVIDSFGQTTKLKPGFDKEEFLELLKVSSMHQHKRNNIKASKLAR
jgi:hypothetical protein